MRRMRQDANVAYFGSHRQRPDSSHRSELKISLNGVPFKSLEFSLQNDVRTQDRGHRKLFRKKFHQKLIISFGEAVPKSFLSGIAFSSLKLIN